MLNSFDEIQNMFFAVQNCQEFCRNSMNFYEINGQIVFRKFIESLAKDP